MWLRVKIAFLKGRYLLFTNEIKNSKAQLEFALEKTEGQKKKLKIQAFLVPV